ncbi:MAG: hypothetical protein KIT07_03280 [Anaerolineales bacterium]|jgi:hypothetical protein|nr:hypothetical protein [Anaerolineales bacterium]
MQTKSDWDVFLYEVQMLFETKRASKLLQDSDIALATFQYPTLKQILPTLRNALTESRVLHCRVLIEILLDKGGHNDDIKLASLLKSAKINETFSQALVMALKQAYGDRNTDGTPCWTFNKMLAHATNHRGLSYDYSAALDRVIPALLECLKELARLNSDRRLSDLLESLNKNGASPHTNSTASLTTIVIDDIS